MATLAAVAFAPVAFGAAGCDRPTSDAPPPEVSSPVRSAPDPTQAPPPIRVTRSATPSPSTFAETYVQPCAGRPSADQVIAVVRRQPSLLPAGVAVTVQTGPLCAGIWQYTVLAVTDHEPMQVVTRGAPQSLTFVTAGTDVCTVQVRANAPVAILNTANC